MDGWWVLTVAVGTGRGVKDGGACIYVQYWLAFVSFGVSWEIEYRVLFRPALVRDVKLSGPRFAAPSPHTAHCNGI